MFHQGARCAPASFFFPRQQAGKYDIRTVTGLNQSLVIRVVDFQGDPVDMSGVTLRGAVRLKTGVTEFGFSRDDEGNGVISWESVPAGMWSYDVFMDDGNEESPLLYGCFVSSGRVTPDLPDEQQAVAGAVVVQLPEGSGCVQVVLDNASSAAWYAEQAKKYAANAGNSEVSAANSAAAAASSATDAAASATSAASSSSDAAHSAANAASSEAKAASSEANAMSSATAAASSASNASLSEANAAASQSSAAASASDAATSATSAATSAHNAAASESSAESSETAASKSASDAATSATSAANSATAAQQALEAIPEVDASGNMTLSGTITATAATINGPLVVNNPDGSGSAGTLNQIYGITRFYQSVDLRSGGWLRGTFMVETGILNISQGASFNCAGAATFSSAVNANGGVNIPLAAGAPANESGVNRLYAAGMGGAANTYTAGAFLNTDSLTTTGTATVTKTVPWQMARIGIPAGSHTTIQAPFEGPNSQWNYSSWAGFSFVWRATTAAKLTMGIGRGAKTIRTDLTTDSYTIIPGNDLAFNSGEILDITFDNVRDTARNGYTVRVREIYALNSTDGWQVKTTTSFIPATQNEPIPWTVCKIIYQQQAVAKSSIYENLGGLWLMVTGAQTNNLYKIATCRGVSNFETGVGVSRWVTDVINTTSGTASVYAGPGEYAYYQPGNVNPVYYGLEAIAKSAIETEETADFEDINVPIEES